MDLTALRQATDNLEHIATTRVATKKMLTKQLEQQTTELKKIERNTKDVMLARDLLEKATDTAREKGCQILTDSATAIVRMVFGSNYELKIKLGVRADVPVADVYFKKQIAHHDQLINIDNDGGGLRDIVSLAFFISIASVVARNNNNGAIIALDEPTPAVSSGYAEETAKAITALLEYANKQAIIITHEREYLPQMIDKVYYIEQGVDGISKATEL